MTSKKNSAKMTIAWTDSSEPALPAYRSTQTHNKRDVRLPTWFGPNPQQIKTNASQDLGLHLASPLQINFSSSHPSPNLNSVIKQPAPVIEVATAAKQAPLQAADDIAPVYDYFQPMLAHFSETMSPTQLRDSVEGALKLLVDAGVIDFYREKPFVFAGRAFAEYGDCEYRITIFSDPEHRSVVEIRRSCGEAFTFANAESKILMLLKKAGAVAKFGDSTSDAASDSASDTSSDGFGNFSFGMLPNYDNVEFDLPADLPRYEMNDTDDETDISAVPAVDASEEKEASEDSNQNAPFFLEQAMRTETVQDEWRFAVVHLKQEMDKNPAVYAAMDGITRQLLKSIGDENFDAFVTRTILQCIACLLKEGATMPDQFSVNISQIQKRWEEVVENQITDHLSFKFAPSQQVVKECEAILKALSEQ